MPSTGVYDVTAAGEELDRLFRWLTRNKMGVSLDGSRSIGWYQVHQCHALDVIKELCLAASALPTAVRVLHGELYARAAPRFQELTTAKARWLRVGTCRQVFVEADKRSRA